MRLRQASKSNPPSDRNTNANNALRRKRKRTHNCVSDQQLMERESEQEVDDDRNSQTSSSTTSVSVSSLFFSSSSSSSIDSGLLGSKPPLLCSSSFIASAAAAAAITEEEENETNIMNSINSMNNDPLQEEYLRYLQDKNTGILQCRIVLDANYDEVTTVFSLAHSNWFQLASLRCWHCSRLYEEIPYMMDPVPCALEMKWNSKNQLSFVVDGSFCSFACSKAWANGIRGGDGNKSADRNHRDPIALSQTQKMSTSSNPNAFLFRAWTGLSLDHYLQLSMALPRRLLKEYGGPLEYNEYAEHSQLQQDPSTIMIDRRYLPFPMISCRQSLLEEVSIQEMTQNLRNNHQNDLLNSFGNLSGGGNNGNNTRTVLPQANLELNKRIQRLRARGGGLNQNEGF